ncbi:MAG TPA: hypothetical protein VFV99_04000 [Kofleriaceae bacterium]|nr:hypothetical protein [Kofleriaceae bacterium]
MRGLLTIARYELTRRWALWLVMAGVGFLARILASFTYDDRLFNVCVVGAVVLSWVVAFIVGMSLFGRALHDGRLGFFFTRPIHGVVIAAGKLVGGLVLILGMEVLLLIPLFSSDFTTTGDDGPRFVIGIALAFLAAGLVVGILARSRSRWFIADAIGGAIAVLLAIIVFGESNAAQRYAIVQKWTPEEAGPMLGRIDTLMRGLAIAAIVVVLAAVTAAITLGRTDRERVHRSLAMTLWSSLAVTGLVGVAFAYWGLL